MPVPVPSGVKVAIADGSISVEGPKGKLEMSMMPEVELVAEGDALQVQRGGDTRKQRAAQGLTRRLVANMVEGVSEGFSKTLEITGVGYRADVQGSNVHLSLGYSHPIIYQLPEGVSATVDNQTVVTISGISRQLVGEVAAEIRKLRPPEPYKGKGIRYKDEYVRRKAGKAGATA